jgi:hypothetical protein
MKAFSNVTKSLSVSRWHCRAGFFGSNATITTNVGNGTPWCLSGGGKLPADTFSLRGNSCANFSRSITFVLDQLRPVQVRAHWRVHIDLLPRPGAS